VRKSPFVVAFVRAGFAVRTETVGAVFHFVELFARVKFFATRAHTTFEIGGSSERFMFRGVSAHAFAGFCILANFASCLEPVVFRGAFIEVGPQSNRLAFGTPFAGLGVAWV